MPARKRKILVPIFFRGHLGRLRSVLSGIRDDPRLDIQIMAASPQPYGSLFSALRHSEPYRWRAALPWYFKAKFISLASIFHPRILLQYDPLVRHITHEGFPIHSRVPFFLDGGTTATMAKSVGIGIVAIVDELSRLKPDIVLVNGDRFEMMAVVLAAAYLNIQIAHHEGGDVSGTIDESVRHAITKFAHIHLTATERSRARVLQMGEDPQFVFTVGSPAMDALKRIDFSRREQTLPGIDQDLPYLLVLVHPVTTEGDKENRRTAESILEALERLKMPAAIIAGNSDAYSHIVGPLIAEWKDRKKPEYAVVTKLLRPDRYARLLAGAACAIGNSSSFIREGAYLGTPSVLVGSRQRGRECGQNVVEVSADPDTIEQAVREQIAHGRYPSDSMFGDGEAGKKIIEILATAEPPIQKAFYDIDLLIKHFRNQDARRISPQ